MVESQGVKIDIELTDDCRNLKIGMHTVSYVAFWDGMLWCIDKDGETHVIECRKFRFARVNCFDTRVTDNGRVSVNVDGAWIDLGPMFRKCPINGRLEPEKFEPVPDNLMPQGERGVDHAA